MRQCVLFVCFLNCYFLNFITIALNRKIKIKRGGELWGSFFFVLFKIL